MNGTKRRILSLVLLIALLAIPTVTVLAKELGQLDISGPGIDGQLTLTDHDQMMKLEGSGFFDQPSMVKPPENLDLGTGYTITAHLNLDGKLVPFVEAVYYPAEEGELGYWHFTGRMNGEKMQAVDLWGQLSPAAENAFRDVMAANKITLQPAIVAAAPAAAAPAVAPADVPAVSPAPSENPYLIPAIIAAALILLGAVLALRRRAVNQSSV